MKFKYEDKVRIIHGINTGKTGEVIGIDPLDTDHAYLVRYGINPLDLGWYRWNELNLIKHIGGNDIKSCKQQKEKDDDDIVERFDKLGKVIEKTVPIIGYIFFSTIISLFVLCIIIFIFGSIGIMQVNYKVLSIVFFALYIFATYITFIIFGEKR